MVKNILLLGITILIGSIYLLNQNDASVQLNGSVDFTERFQKFKARFGKKYGSAEEIYRLTVFKENMIQADLHNQNPESTYTMGETPFADLKKQEFVDIYLRKQYKKDENKQKIADDYYFYPIYPSPKTFPASFDWRKYPGVSTKAKSQGMCGSCWAFSAVSEIESYFATRKGVLNLDLSEQQLIDCDTYSFGCYGGNENTGLEYATKYGITSEDVYPYTGQDGSCQIKTGPYQINGVRQVLINDINALKGALSVQPVTVSVESENWYLYTGGIFNHCEFGYPWDVDHAVIAFGYDSDSWIIKNSWGPEWGENGYIRLATGNCNNVLQYMFVAI